MRQVSAANHLWLFYENSVWSVDQIACLVTQDRIKMSSDYRLCVHACAWGCVCNSLACHLNFKNNRVDKYFYKLQKHNSVVCLTKNKNKNSKHLKCKIKCLINTWQASTSFCFICLQTFVCLFFPCFLKDCHIILKFDLLWEFI